MRWDCMGSIDCGQVTDEIDDEKCKTAKVIYSEHRKRRPRPYSCLVLFPCSRARTLACLSCHVSRLLDVQEEEEEGGGGLKKKKKK